MELGAERVGRRLAAIMAADVAGYSRLMESDEVGTLRALVAHREVMGHLIADHGGRIANTAGDSVLAEFPSVVNAVQCAVQIQQRLSSDLSEPKLQFRIGIHVGDVMVHGGDLLGDGVNVAARLQSIAVPGGICISGAAHDYVRKTLSLSFTDLGSQRVKNIEESVRAYAWTAISPTPATVGGIKSLSLPDKPSIAVLPFTNMSGDPEQEYFVDGIVEDILTALSSFRWLFVIARNSSSTYRGQSVTMQQVGRELGVRYILEGSVRKAGARIRVTAQLVEAETGAHLWAERYDRDISDLFELQDEITSSVVGAIEPQLFAAEAHRVERRPTSDLKAWECTMRSLPYIWRLTIEDTEKAQEWLRRAIHLDPNYAYAHALMGWSFMKLWGLVDSDRQQDALQSSSQFARNAALLDDREPWTYLVTGLVHTRRKEPDQAVAALRRALMLNPNFALAHAYLGYSLGVSGQPDTGLASLERAVRLSPRDPFLASDYSAIRGMIEFAAGNYEEVIRIAKRMVQDRPDHIGAHRMLAASYALSGQVGESERSLQEVLRLHPGFRLPNVRSTAVYTDQDALERYCDGLRKAGLPG